MGNKKEAWGLDWKKHFEWVCLFLYEDSSSFQTQRCSHNQIWSNISVEEWILIISRHKSKILLES